MHYSITMIVTAILLFTVGFWLVRKFFFVALLVGIGLLVMHYYGYDVLSPYLHQL